MSTTFPKAREIFLAALKQPDRERGQYLEDACGDDVALHERLKHLLHAHQEAGSLPPLAPDPTSERPVEQPGTLIGPYKLLEVIGEGGFGVVFMAEQQEPVHRKVALKVIKPGMDSRQVVARFEAERQALALMDHPNIAKVFDGGKSASGRPFFVMELVRGVPITNYCDQNRLSVRARLNLFVSACQAVQHAHQKGVIHRDLKPSNIMVTLHDGTPVVKVIDFGIAKAMGPQLTEKTLFTSFAQMMGTPLYMSPEQAEMSGLDVDTRTDIYSLGVLLYELLTGTTPFEKERLRTASYDEIRRIIREDEPLRPSTRISTLGPVTTELSANRQSDLPRLQQMFRGELDWIVMKALEKDRNRRYESASALAAEVQRYLNDEPVQACPPTVWYRFRRIARRNKVEITTAALVCAALVLGTAVSAWQAIRARQAEQQARVSLAAEKQARQNAEQARRDSNASLLKARQVVDQYLTLTSESRLLEVPGLQPLRKELLEAALVYYEDFLKQRPRDPALLADAAAGYLRVAHIYNALDDSGKALSALEQGIKLVEQLHREFLELPDWPLRVAGTYKVQPDLHFGSEGPAAVDEALTLLERAIQLWQEMSAEHPTVVGFKSDLARLHSFRAELELACGRRDRALAGHQRARNLWESLARENPSVPEYRAELSCSFDGMGKMLDRLQRPQEAEDAFRQCLELRQRLAADYPGRPDYRYEVALAELRLTRKLPVARSAEAVAKYREIKELLAALITEFPNVPSFRENLGICHYDLACALWRADQFDAAIRECRQCLAIAEHLAADFADLPEYRVRLAGRSRDLAVMLSAAKQYEEAEGCYARAIEVMEKRAAETPQIVFRRSLMAIYEDQGDFLLALQRPAEAAAAYRRAIELSKGVVSEAPDVPLYLCELAAFLANCPVVELRNSRRAIELATQATQIAPQESAPWYALGLTHYRASHWVDALTALKRWQELSSGGDSREWLLLALTNWRLSQMPEVTNQQRDHYRAEARDWYARGAAWQDQFKPLNANLSRLRSETAALLQVDDPIPAP
jgi:serine/threonine protein kinase